MLSVVGACHEICPLKGTGEKKLISKREKKRRYGGESYEFTLGMKEKK